MKRDFLTSMKLDCGTKVRSYVEGHTELGALTSAVGETKEERFFGRFSISTPDFEFANFAISELIDAAVEISGRQATEPLDIRAPKIATARSRSGKEFLAALNNVGKLAVQDRCVLSST